MPEQPAASGKPEPVESLLDEDDFAVIAEENLESPRDASDAATRAEVGRV